MLSFLYSEDYMGNLLGKGDEKPRKMWERWPSERNEPWEGFQLYLSLPTKSNDADERRTLSNVARKLDKSLTLISSWSANNGWVERARVYDDDLSLVAFDMQTVELARYQANVLQAESEELWAMGEIFKGALRTSLAAVRTEGSVTGKELLNLLEAGDRLAKMRRRLAKLPASYMAAMTEDVGEEEPTAPRTYIVGAPRQESTYKEEET